MKIYVKISRAGRDAWLRADSGGSCLLDGRFGEVRDFASAFESLREAKAWAAEARNLADGAESRDVSFWRLINGKLFATGTARRN